MSRPCGDNVKHGLWYDVVCFFLFDRHEGYMQHRTNQIVQSDSFLPLFLRCKGVTITIEICVT